MAIGKIFSVLPATAAHGAGVGKRQRSLQVVQADEEYGAGADADRQGDQVEVQERAVGVQLIVLSWGAAAGPTLREIGPEFKGAAPAHGLGRSAGRGPTRARHRRRRSAARREPLARGRAG